VLFSKINPRIPRVCVVPEARFPLACSTEFEILRPLEIDPHLLVALLKTPPVQEQVEYLTSGTSSSHSRIKDSELAEILIPIPQKGSRLARDLDAVAETLRQSTTERYQVDEAISKASERLRKLVSQDSSEQTTAGQN
jgi:restriction endonuclease S subunit